MHPMINFMGGKWKLARKLGPPQRDHVAECFAGGAGYSCYWEPAKVTLIERDPILFGIWDYLTHVKSSEVMALPVNIDDVDELPASVCQEARNLVGFWLNRGLTQPAKRRSGWARSDSPYRSFFWDQMIRKRIASQVDRVKHWKVIHGSYEDAPDIAAHWHVDPPYAVAGKAYKYNEVDYPALAQWVRTRRGFTQVCEQTGADWLPFRPYAIVNSHRTRPFSSEAVYEFDSEAAE